MGTNGSKSEDATTEETVDDNNVDSSSDQQTQEDAQPTDDGSKDQAKDDVDSSNNDSVKEKPTPGKLSNGAIAGIVVAVVVVIAVVIAVAVVLSTPSSSTSASGSASSGSASSAVFSTGSFPISSGSAPVSSSSVAPTKTLQLLGVNVVGVPNPAFPGKTNITGPFAALIPATSDATIFLVMNDDPDTFSGRLTGSSYGGGNSLTIASINTSGAATLTVSVLGYELRPNSGNLQPDVLVPFCNTYVLNLPTIFAASTTLGIPFSLTGSPTDYVCFVQNGDVNANSAIVSGSTVASTTTVQFAYNAAIVGSCRFNLIVAKIKTAAGSSSPLLYAENVTLNVSVGLSFVNYTLKSNVTNGSGTIQWLAQQGVADRFSEVQAIKQISANQVRLACVSISSTINVTIMAFRSTTSTGFVF